MKTCTGMLRHIFCYISILNQITEMSKSYQRYNNIASEAA